MDRYGRFRDRWEAGRLLGEKLAVLKSLAPVILGLPRGGVVVAAEVAATLRAPLDVILVRKLGVPYQPELAMGAIGEDGIRILDESMLAAAGLTKEDVEQVEQRERANLARAAERFRGNKPPISVENRSVVIVDDGIATGATVRAGCEVARQRRVKDITVAAPISSVEAATRLRSVADNVVCLATSNRFVAISQFYEDFTPVEDDVVVSCLAAASARIAGSEDNGP
jgi:putative phosphoribosyl transferase